MEQCAEMNVKSTRDLGLQFVRNDHRMVGQDGAYSIPLAGGGALWYFGDTLVGERPARSLYDIFREVVDGKVETGPGPFDQMITNTGLLLPEQTGADGLHGFRYVLDASGQLKKLVPSLPAEDPELERVWCMHGLEVNGRLYLGYMLVLMHQTLSSPDEIGFEVLGSGLAVGDSVDWNFRRLAGGVPRDPHDDTIWWDVSQPQFGAAILHSSGDEHIYLFGTLQDAQTEIQQAHLARVQADAIEQLTRYEYFDGHGWSPDVRHSIPLFGGQPNELSVSYNTYLGQYLAVHSMSLTGDIVGRTAPHVWGPWSEPVVLWTVPESERAVPPGQPPRSFYAGKEHPALAAEQGRILYLTYVDNVDYFPHLIEVTLR